MTRTTTCSKPCTARTHPQVRLSELTSENKRMQQSDRERAAAERETDAEVFARNWLEEGHQGEEEIEMEELCDEPGMYEPEEEGKGMLLRFLRGIQPVSYVYWEN